MPDAEPPDGPNRPDARGSARESAAPVPMPAADVDITPRLVRSLLAEQHPDLEGLTIEPLAFGWDNVSFRVGERLVVRLPRRQLAAVLVEHEQRWLPQLAPLLPLPVPVPLRVGVPALGYPYAWSVVPWLPGSSAAVTPPNDALAAARTLGGFVRALHQPAPDDAPRSEFRGIPLHRRDELTRQWLEHLETERRAAGVGVWEAGLAAAPHAGAPVWVHGDLHPANLLVGAGRLSAVIDFGDLNAGDPATDWAAGWMLLPAAAHDTFRDAAGGVDDGGWVRAKAWALSIGAATFANSADNPLMHDMGEAILARVLDSSG